MHSQRYQNFERDGDEVKKDIDTLIGANILLSMIGANILLSMIGANILLSIIGANILLSIGANILLSIIGANILLSIILKASRLTTTHPMWFSQRKVICLKE
jgi:hypothetical protein